VCAYAVDYVCAYAVDDVCAYAVDDVCAYVVDDVCAYAVDDVCSYAVDDVCAYAVDHVCSYAVDDVCAYAVDHVCAYGIQGHGGGEQIKSRIRDLDALPSARSSDHIISTKLADIEDTEDTEENPFYKQMFAILQPAFDKKILCEGRMRELIDADGGLPIDFIASLLNIYKQEQRETLELIRKSLYEGDSSTQLKGEVVFADTGFLVDKMRSSAMNLGDEVVVAVCTELQQICVDEDLEAYLADGPGKLVDLVEASKISAAYFKRLFKFIKT
jgi:hypothetical protein